MHYVDVSEYSPLLFQYVFFKNKFIIFFQDSANGTPVTLRVDEKGFFLYWTDQNKVCKFINNILPIFCCKFTNILCEFNRNHLLFILNSKNFTLYP